MSTLRRLAAVIPMLTILAMLTAGYAIASCDDDERPSLPEPISINSTINSIKVSWTPNGSARFYDLNIRQISNNTSVFSVTGGLENQRRYIATNLAPGLDRFLSPFSEKAEGLPALTGSWRPADPAPGTPSLPIDTIRG